MNESRGVWGIRFLRKDACIEQHVKSSKSAFPVNVVMFLLSLRLY